MSDTLNLINQYLDTLFAYGPFWVYLVIFLACLIENLFPPFPGDTFILAGGGLVAMERLNLMATIAVVIVGGMISVMILYHFGRTRGRSYFLKKDFKFLPAADILKVENKFARWGAVILIFSRFVVGIRAGLAVIAGIGQYRPERMLLFSAISYVLFTGLVMYIAVKLVENYERIEHLFRTYNTIAWPIVIAVVLLYVIAGIVKQRKQT